MKLRFRKIFDLKAFRLSLSDIYSTKNDEAKGRLITLGSSMMAAFYNVFVTGIFYTGFLSMYDISITGVGIISFIPYIASCFSLFSPAILERIKKRKWVLLGAKVYFYGMYIIATTLMPQFVKDSDARLVWFIVILFLAYSVYALFSPGLTAWFYRFYPEDNDRRARYIALNQVFSSVLSSAILLLSGLLTDAVAGSPIQNQLILGMRYFAFVLVLIDVGMQACAKEYPYPKSPKLNLLQVFTLPFKYRKFLLCMLLSFYWYFVQNLNNGLWNYHLLNHLGFSYTFLNIMSVMFTVILILSNSTWKRVLHRYSWVKTFGFAILFFMPTEFLMFSMIPGRTYALYIPASIVQSMMTVGMNLTFPNLLYMNLPEENSTAHIAFYTIGCNLFAFLGMSFGTWVSSLTGDNTIMFLGMPVYSVQFTTLLRVLFMLPPAYILLRYWRAFTPDSEIAAIEDQARVRRELKQKLGRQPVRWKFALPRKKSA